MKRTVVIALLMMAGSVVMARPVDVQKARGVAEAFLHRSDLVDVSKQTPFMEFYTFTFNNGEGFILVSADDCVTPVLGYSTDSPVAFGAMPANLRSWLEGYEAEIRYCRTHGFTPTAEIEQQWQGEWAAKNPVKSVPALVKTKWDQGSPYNNLCPIKEGDAAHAYTGCTATAMAQIMKYWNHPATGYGQHSYFCKGYDTLSVDFGATTFQWDSMPAKLNSNTRATRVAAVATLMYNCGVSVDMGYSTSGSGAFTLGYGRDTMRCSEYSLVEHFKYRNTLRSVSHDDFGDDVWIDMLKHEFDNKRPVLYTGYDREAGHAFVADGYDDKDYVHFNWGWSGSYDGFFKMGHLNPGEGSSSQPGAGSSGSYNRQCSALMGIEPDPNFGQGCKVEAVSADENMGTVSGSGSYEFGQRAILFAAAKEGYRFAEWSDGNRYNPRVLTMTSADRSLTAVFKPLHPDTMHYVASNLWFGNAGVKVGDKYWGIRFPASVMKPGYVMTGARFFATHSANYDVEVFEGSVDEAGKLYSKEVFVPNVDKTSWIPVEFDSAVHFSGNKPVWIRMHSKGVEKVAVYTASAGTIDGRLWGEKLDTDTLGNQGWMIQGIFQHPDSVNVEIKCIGNGEVLYGDNNEVVSNSWVTLPKGEWMKLGLRGKDADLLRVYVNDVDYRDSVVMVDTIGADTYELHFQADEYTVVRVVFDGWNGIDQVEGTWTVSVNGGRIQVSGADKYFVYDLAGRRIDHQQAPLPAGVYMVQVPGTKARKVVVAY